MIDAILALGKDWGAFAGLVLLGWILPQAVSKAYAYVRAYLDRKHPDDLPFGGGAWIEEQAKDLGIEVRVLCVPTQDDNIDAFVPSKRLIVLGKGSYFKKDPSFWAMAAHELGHLLFDRRVGLVGSILLVMRVVGRGAGSAGALLVLANVLYAAPVINEIAFVLLGTSIVCSVFVMFDEACASTIAIRMLARDRRIDANALGGAIIGLFAAFLTYVGGFVGQLILVLQRNIVVAKIDAVRRFVPSAPLGTGKLVFAALLSLLLLYVAFRMVKGALRPAPVSTAEAAKLAKSFRVVRELVASVVAMVFVVLVWDQPFGVAFAIVCTLAILASRSAIVLATAIARAVIALLLWLPIRVLALPAVLLASAIGSIFKSSDWEAKGAEYGHISLPPPRQPTADEREAARAMDVLTQMSIELANDPPWNVRAAEIAYAACHVVFVIAFWAGTLGILR